MSILGKHQTIFYEVQEGIFQKPGQISWEHSAFAMTHAEAVKIAKTFLMARVVKCEEVYTHIVNINQADLG